MIKVAARWMVLTALLAGALPSPASAQLGGFIKRKLKQKAVSTAVDTVLSKVAGGDSTASAAKAGGRRASAAARVAAPTFDENTLEITPAVLDRLARALSAQRKAGKQGAAAALKAGDFTAGQYATLKERVLPVCAAPDAAQASGAAVRVPGAASGLDYVYTQGEVDAMRPRCAKLTPLLEAAR